MIGKGKSYGAITVINAIPRNIGATIGIALKTTAEFDPTGDSKKVIISNEPAEDTKMAMYCVEEAYKTMKKPEPVGWTLTVNSEIPISRGLKSSSSACNAILASVFDCYKHKIKDIEMIKIGVKCAKKAGVTVTGSFDDACGCHFGGLVITDNIKNEVLFTDDIGDYDVILHVPETKIKKDSATVEKMKNVNITIEAAIGIANAFPLKAMMMNSRTIANAAGLDHSVADEAISLGALAAGISGTGPATAIVVEEGKGKAFAERMKMDNLIVTKVRRPKK